MRPNKSSFTQQAGRATNLHQQTPTNTNTRPAPQVIVPKDVSTQCCGMMFNSRGCKDAAAAKGAALEKALLEASQGGKIPIVMDTSPCLSQVKASISEPSLRFALYEPVEFIRCGVGVGWCDDS